MDLFQAAIFGLVQGLTEFLPVSSSAHLILLPWFMKWEDPGLTFDVALHFGTLVALAAYFFKDWKKIIGDGLRTLPRLGQFKTFTQEERIPYYLVLASIPAGLLGLLFENKIETVLRSPLIMAVTLPVMGVILFLADRLGKKKRPIGAVTLKDAMTVGVFQSFALIPGVSRSGSTMTAGLFLGLERAAAARFSFLLSFPITLGACLMKLRHLGVSDLTPPFLVGVGVSFISGWLAIDVLLKMLRTRSFGVFAAYRIIVALGILIVWYTRGS